MIAIDTVAERLQLARDSGAETLDFMQDDIYDRLMEITKGRGADACIDAVGTEADPAASLEFPLGSHQNRHVHGDRSATRASAGNSLLS